MKAFTIIAISLLISFISNGQSIVDLSVLTESPTINIIQTELMSFGFTYDRTEMLSNTPMPTEAVYFKKDRNKEDGSLTTITINKNVSLTNGHYVIQFSSHSDKDFYRLRKELESYPDVDFIKDEFKDGEYRKIYIKGDLLYIFSVSESEAVIGGKIYVIGIVNRKDKN